jgi:cysteine desulfurase
LKKALTPKTLLVSIMHVNNEIGIINDINAIGAITREQGTVFHTDAVQGFGKIPINVRQMNIDLLSISGHKLYAPKGIGALYVRKGIHLQKLLHGGSNERNWRSGTENVASAVGLGASAALCKTEMEQEADALRKLRNYFWVEIQKNIPDVRLNGALEPRLPGNLNVSFKSADGESILLSLDLHGIAASAGSACESGSIELTHVIKALNPPLEYAQSAIRFTIGRWTTRAEIDYTISALKEIIERVRKFERKN